LGSPGYEKITDFNPNDILKFNMFGVNNLNDLVKAITKVVDTPNSVVFTFFNSLQVELVGFHSNTNFTAAMFQFS
jgi:flagellar biosynthesis protein FlhB